MIRSSSAPVIGCSGTVRVSGATKNAGTKQMAAALLAPGVTTLRNVDPVADLDVMIDVLRAIGAGVEWTGPSELRIDASASLHAEAPYELVTRMRASINVLGPLLARCGQARVAMPGGDNIGSRKLDMHFRGLESMGVELDVVHGFIEARTNRLSGARVVLEFPSVGATENLLTAAVLAKGSTVIENAAREPEITDLADMLNRMGAEIHGAGTSTISVEGVEALVPVDSEIMGDRIETGTLLMACGIAGGECTLLGARLDHVETVVMKLTEMGLQVSQTPDGLWARADERLRAVDIATLPFPGFATDFMPLAVALLATADGTAIVTENVFDNRLGFVAELNRMGADIRHEGRHAVIRGVRSAVGRAGARRSTCGPAPRSVLAGFAADGETVVLDPFHVDRGYSDLAALAARPRRRRRTRPRLALSAPAYPDACPGSSVRSDPARPGRRASVASRPAAASRRASATRSTPTPVWSRAARATRCASSTTGRGRRRTTGAAPARRSPPSREWAAARRSLGAMQDSVTVHVDAPPAKVWELVSDVTNTGRFSPETFEAEWLDGSTGPEVGATFRGHVKRNGRGPTYWTKCTVVASRAGQGVHVRGRHAEAPPDDLGVPIRAGRRRHRRHRVLPAHRPAAHAALLEALREGPGPHQRPQHAGHPRADQGHRRGVQAGNSGRPAILVVFHHGTPVTGAP